MRTVHDLTTEIAWENNESRAGQAPAAPFMLTSMPRNSSADDWQVNHFDREGKPREAAPHRRAAAGTLFE